MTKVKTRWWPVWALFRDVGIDLKGAEEFKCSHGAWIRKGRTVTFYNCHPTNNLKLMFEGSIRHAGNIKILRDNTQVQEPTIIENDIPFLW